MNVPAWCVRWVGVPYDRLNCWELVRGVYSRQLGVDLPDIAVPETDDGRREAIEGYRTAEWLPVRIGEEEEFDVAELALPVRDGDRWRFLLLHLGVVARRGLLLHTLPPHGAHVRRYGPARAMPERFWRWCG